MSRTGFHAAERLIDFANAVRADPELRRATAVGLFLEHGERHEDLTEQALTDGALAELRDAVLRMTDVLTETDVDRAALALNALLAEHAAAPRLSRHDGHGWHLHVDHGDDAGWADWFLASGALALAQILSEQSPSERSPSGQGRVPWGECAAPGCRTLYLGTGPGSPRRYCSTTCASRARVAEHRRRKAEAAGRP